jgi:hypothetical protein
MSSIRSLGGLFVAAFFVVWLPLAGFGFQAPPESNQAASAADDSYSPRGPYFGRLVIPDVVRFDKLPMRMHLEPSFEPPKIFHSLNERMVPLFIRALRDAKDLEVRTVAAMSLSRVAQFEEFSIDPAADQILATLRTATEPSVLYATAIAAAYGDIEAAAPELIQFAETANDAHRAVIEPALIRWKAQGASKLWSSRLTDPVCSEISFRLGAEGVAALQDSSAVTPLSEAVANEALPFGKRYAAAKALALLDSAKGLSLASVLIKGEESDRILALSLLDSTLPESWLLAATLCTDASNAVASNAWQLVLNRKPDLLLPHLPIGRVHGDSVVRISAAKTMKLFPVAERCSWLNEMLDDGHIQVRNTARRMLADVAFEETTLYEQIVGEAVGKLRIENTNWQGIEQSLVLLGQIRAFQFSAQCFPLLKYPRDEVSVSAAWLIHLFPDEAFRSLLLSTVQDTEQEILKPEQIKSDSILKQQHLLQAAALLRIQEIKPLLQPKFSKTAPGGILERAAALWALGMLHEGNPDPSIIKQLEERIEDRASVPPEFQPVRRSCVMALGLMRAKSSVKVLSDSYSIDPSLELIPATARFALGVIGEEMPPPIPDIPESVGGWKINPPSP